MEARHDLGKFITELPVAERGAVLSSGREHLASSPSVQTIAHRGGTTTFGCVSPAQSRKRIGEIDNVGRLTPGAGIESSTQIGSDQTAAEALQEAETEVGLVVKVDRVAGSARWSIDRPTRRPRSALRPGS